MKRKPENLEDLISDESYQRYVKEEADGEEVRVWQEWINESPAHLKMHNEAKSLLKNLRIVSFKQPDELQAADRFNKRLHLETAGLNHHKIHRLSWTALIKIAAAITLIAVSGYFYWGYYLNHRSAQNMEVPSQTIATNYGVQKTIKLSDGSRIILAPNSSITYKKDWLKHPVKRLALKGAAYFDIKSKPKAHLPEFEIETADGVIRDYGTQFNVSTFNNHTSVVLQKGVVSISGKNNHDKEIRLKPRQMAILSMKQPSVQIQEVDPRVYTSWTTHLLYFDHTPLSELTQSLSNRYGLKFIVEDSSLLQKQLTGAIDKTDVKSLLSVVSRILHIKMTIQGDTVHIQHLDL